MAATQASLFVTIPATNNIVDSSGKLQDNWLKFFKNQSDISKRSTSITSKNTSADINLPYVLCGAVCHIAYKFSAATTAEQTIKLPFASVSAFIAAGNAYSAGTSTITVPAGTDVLQFWYIISANQ